MARQPLLNENVTSAIASDALRACGKHFQAMDGGIRPLDPAMRIVGTAFTVRCYPGATWALEQSIERAQPGDVLVVDGGAASDVILMGGLLSTRMQQRGLAGAIVDGAVRDIEDIIDLGFPVFSRHICPRAGTFAEIGEWQVTICCGRLPVEPGDIVIADRNGIAVIPAAVLDDVRDKAAEILAKEAFVAERLHNGASLSDAAKPAG
jgi:4-hydroxy-4-methyl-2-oxoglutarate aldolase